MKVTSNEAIGFEKVHLEASDGQIIIIPWSEFWEICREGTHRETYSEVWEYISQCDKLAGFDCADITEEMVREIVDTTIKTRVAKENSDDIYDAALTVLREHELKHPKPKLNTYNIGFVNDESRGDQTQFDAKDANEALELFADFCRENGFDADTLEYIEKI